MNRRTSSDWDNIIESWKHSGLSHKDYCQKKNLNYWTFRDQRLKREKVPLKSSKNNLVKISTSIQAPKKLLPITIVTLPSGITIQIPDGFNKESFQEVMNIIWDFK